MKGQITELSNLKTKFKDNVTIKINITDNFDNSIILVDKNKPEKTIIKVESRHIWKSGIERGSDLVFREDNENNYSEWKKLYDDILDSSKDYIG